MCNICAVKFLGRGISDELHERIVHALNELVHKQFEELPGLDPANKPILSDLPKKNLAAAMSYYFNVELNHRGRASSGIYTFDHEPHFHGDMGLAPDVFNLEALLSLTGFVSLGHDRYATTGLSSKRNIQPLILDNLALAHNGNLTNQQELRELIGDELTSGKSKNRIKTTTDSELILHKILIEISRNPNAKLDNVVKQAMKNIRGAYSVVSAFQEDLFAFRDPYGIRPLMFAQFEDDFVVFASEGAAIYRFAEAAGYKRYDALIRQVDAGELIIASDGVRNYRKKLGRKKKRFCAFELTYLMSPNEEDAAKLRQVLGRKLWEKEMRRKKIRAANDDDFSDQYYVCAVPNSGILYARGFSEESKMPFDGDTITISPNYYSRSFMEPSQALRKRKSKEKYTFEEPSEKFGMYLTDDSIVRSTTMVEIVRNLRDKGLDELHVRSGSPMMVNPCWLGIHIPDTQELIAADITKKQVETYFESVFYGVDYDFNTLKKYVKDGRNTRYIVKQSIQDRKNVYMNDLSKTKVKKGNFTLDYVTLTEFREAFDEIGIKSNNICTACMQKNLSGYAPPHKRDLLKAHNLVI